ncbi:MAG: thiamine ABC transporter substrate binding subunit [Ilumatobacter sp.]
MIPNPRVRAARRAAASVVIAALALAACGSDDSESIETPDTSQADTETDSTDGASSDDAPAEEPATTITLVTYESFPSEGAQVNELLGQFTDETGIAVEILTAGDTGTMLSKAELTAGNPEGDVMWGIDNSFLSRAIDSEIFEPYVANGLDSIDAQFTDLVPNGEATPVDFGDVCVNYDIAALGDSLLPDGNSFEALADASTEGQLVVQNPATSSPGLAFLLATIDEFGEDGWQDYWRSLVDNGVQVTDGWSDAYYGEFTYAGGDRPFVVSYGSSPPVEVIFAEEELTAAPTGVLGDTCYRQIEFAGVLAGTEHPEEAGQLIDFMITTEFQSALPLDVFVFPVNNDVELDPVFVEFAVIPETSRSLDPVVVNENREAWIDEWTDIVLG